MCLETFRYCPDCRQTFTIPVDDHNHDLGDYYYILDTLCYRHCCWRYQHHVLNASDPSRAIDFLDPLPCLGKCTENDCSGQIFTLRCTEQYRLVRRFVAVGAWKTHVLGTSRWVPSLWNHILSPNLATLQRPSPTSSGPIRPVFASQPATSGRPGRQLSSAFQLSRRPTTVHRIGSLDVFTVPRSSSNLKIPHLEPTFLLLLSSHLSSLLFGINYGHWII
jgi:hypothetical protein